MDPSKDDIKLCSILCIIIFVCCVNLAHAQVQIKKGDKVKGKINGKPYEGIVLEAGRGPYIKVRFGDGKGNFVDKEVSARDVVLLKSKLKTSSAKQRLWIVGKSREKVNATLIGKNEKEVVLRKSDGAQLRLKIDELGPFDRRYVSQFEDTDSSGSKGADDSSGTNSPAAGSLMQSKKIDLDNGGEKVNLALVTGWGMAPDQAVALPPKNRNPIVIKAIPENPFGGTERLWKFSFTEDQRHVITSHTVSVKTSVIKSSSTQFIQVSEVADTTKSRLFKIPKKMGFRLYANGYLLTTSKTELDVWSLDSFKQIKSWLTGKSFKVVSHLHDSWIASFDDKGMFAVWNFLTGEVKFCSKCYPLHLPAFSPNGKFAALPLERGVVLVSCDDGKVVGSIKTEKIVNRWAFSPDSSKLAGAYYNNISVWSMEDGSQVSDFFQNGSGKKGLIWVNESQMLVDHQYLVDTDFEFEVWRFKNSSLNRLDQFSPNGQVWFTTKTSSGSGQTIIPCDIPDELIREKMAVLSSNELKVIEPGMKFRVSFEGLDMPADLQREVKQVIKKKFDDNEFVYDADASNIIRVFVKKGEPQTAVYQSRPHLNYKTSFTPHYCWVVIENQNEVLWKSRTVAEPGPFVQLRPNESLNDYAKRASQPRPIHFKIIKIPKSYSRLPNGQDNLGTSSFSSSGLVHD